MGVRRTSRDSSLTAPLHPGCRERRKADIRKRLFRAAIRLFASRGFTATTVEEITQAAGVGKGTFFNYFPTKEHLLADFMERRLDILRAAQEEARQGRTPAREVLWRLLHAVMEEPGRTPAMSRCMILGALGEKSILGVVQGLIVKGQEILAELMAIGQRRGEIRRDWSAAELARLFQQSFYGVMYLWALHPNLNLPRCLDSTSELFWAGIETRNGLLKNPRKKTA